MVSVTASFLTLEYTVLSPSKQKSQSSSEKATSCLPPKPLSSMAGNQGGHSFPYTWVCVCLQIRGTGENPSQRERERERDLYSYLLVWRPHQRFKCTSSVAQYLHPDCKWGVRQSRKLLRAPHSCQQPDAAWQQEQTSSWGSTNSILFNLPLSLTLHCLVCKHMRRVPHGTKTTEMELFLLSHFITQISWSYLKTYLTPRQKAKTLRFPKSEINTHPQPHEPSDAMKCLVEKLWLLSVPNSSALINAAGLICAVHPLTELHV